MLGVFRWYSSFWSVSLWSWLPCYFVATSCSYVFVWVHRSLNWDRWLAIKQPCQSTVWWMFLLVHVCSWDRVIPNQLYSLWACQGRYLELLHQGGENSCCVIPTIHFDNKSSVIAKEMTSGSFCFNLWQISSVVKCLRVTYLRRLKQFRWLHIPAIFKNRWSLYIPQWVFLFLLWR